MEAQAPLHFDPMDLPREKQSHEPVAQLMGTTQEAEVVSVENASAPVVTAPVHENEVLVDLATRVQQMREELNLPQEYVEDLLKLVGTDIVVIADDSGSMNSISNALDVEGPKTRWQELQRTLRMLVTMLLVVEHFDGFWLKFLNDQQWYKVTNAEQLERIFSTKPRAKGKTPLHTNLAPIMRGYGNDENDTLLLIMTDGEPSDCDFPTLAGLIRSKPNSVYCSFAMCTDEENVVDVYNKTVDPIPGCDITDDYAAECRETQMVGNSLTPYQWLAKMLLVKFPKYDHLDEFKLGKTGAKVTPMCCAIA